MFISDLLEGKISSDTQSRFGLLRRRRLSAIDDPTAWEGSSAAPRLCSDSILDNQLYAGNVIPTIASEWIRDMRVRRAAPYGAETRLIWLIRLGVHPALGFFHVPEQ